MGGLREGIKAIRNFGPEFPGLGQVALVAGGAPSFDLFS
jgi:hypothetical protein